MRSFPTLAVAVTGLSASTFIIHYPDLLSKPTFLPELRPRPSERQAATSNPRLPSPSSHYHRQFSSRETANIPHPLQTARPKPAPRNHPFQRPAFLNLRLPLLQIHLRHQFRPPHVPNNQTQHLDAELLLRLPRRLSPWHRAATPAAHTPARGTADAEPAVCRRCAESGDCDGGGEEVGTDGDGRIDGLFSSGRGGAGGGRGEGVVRGWGGVERSR